MKFIFSFRFGEDNVQVEAETGHVTAGGSTDPKHYKDTENPMSNIAYRTNMHQPIDLRNF